MITLNNINFSYDEKKVLRDLSLHIKDNQKVSIIGKSGCGKSTLLKLILGVNTNYSGTAQVFGESITDVRSDIGVVFQHNGLFEFMTIEENLLQTKVTKSDVFAMCERLGIEALLSKYPKALSGGQLQRANIARSLLAGKKLILLDEPTSSLDEFAKEEFQKQVSELLASSDFGYVIVTHDIKEALVMSERIIMMEDGNVKKEFVSPYFGKPDSYLSEDFNRMYLDIKKEFYA